MRPGFALSNWREGTWDVADGLLHQRRNRLAELDARLRLTREIYGGDCSWIKIRRVPWPAMVTGERDWTDYEAHTDVRVTGGGRAGLAVRWEDARHCYYLLLETSESLVLYRREHDKLTELARAPFPHDTDTFYALVVRAEGDVFDCGIEGGPFFTARDGSWTSGRVALVAECPAAYRSLHVEGTRRVAKRVHIPPGVVPRVEASVPIAPFREDTEERPMLYQLNGRPVIVRRPANGRELVLVDADGKEMFRLGPWEKAPGSGGDAPLQMFDINGDGRDELVLVADGRIRVFNGEAGTELAACDAPEPNPYGECSGEPEWACVDDALCPVNLGKPGGTAFYVKDRYWNIHLYTASLEHLWHRPLNTGHFPLPLDVNADGSDEVLCGHTLLDIDGNVIWRLDLNDHVDAIAYMSPAIGKPPQLYIMAGEEGLLHVDPNSGTILSQQLLGHVQNCTVGQFLPGRPGLQLLVVTAWREPSIHYLLDEDLVETARWENAPTLYQLSSSLLPWGDRDLLVGQQGILDPLTGALLHEFPVEPLQAQWVTDWPGIGPSRLVQGRGSEVVIQGPASGEVRYNSPVRPIHSGYLPNGPMAWAST